ncbi:MAG: hypothetical protein KF881_13655, partial [Acidobacteria bacterium]|nr:hypothetical protein [Acidobacteriota bacterium]
LQILNLISILALLKSFFGFQLEFSFLYVIAVAIAAAIIIEALNTRALVSRGRLREILATYANECEKQKSIRRIWCWGYEIGSYAAFYLAAWLLIE